MEGPPDGATPSYKAVIVSRYHNININHSLSMTLFNGFGSFCSRKMSREELNMHSLTLIPDDTLTLVAKMVFVQVDLFELFFLLYFFVL